MSVPPASEQRRIGAVLNRFSSIVDNLSVDLHNELQSRHMQYEYYRDKLLDFEELPA